jgi:hypothetical protein
MLWIEYLGVSVILRRHKQLEFGPLMFFIRKIKLNQENGKQLFSVILLQKSQLPVPFSRNYRTSAVHVCQAVAC